MDKNYDFGGWATVNDLPCADGRTIKKDAFAHNDGEVVPLVWNHGHQDSTNVLGHALLHNTNKGVYAYGYFNDTETGQNAKELVKHGDIAALSIFANKLKQNGKDVVHGVIREVSLVLAGANPGALIDDVICHDDSEEESAVIYTGAPIASYENEVTHSETQEGEEMNNENMHNENLSHADDETIGDVFDTLNKKQKTVVYALIGEALKSKETDEEDNELKQNLFDNESNSNDTLMHDAMNTIMADGKRYGSLKESYLAHAAEYGIENMDFINTEDKNYYDRPEFIKRNPSGWISTVMSGVHHTPFDKVKTIFANITEDEARAKGYIKGKYKKEEVFSLLKRSVSATTIYKKQKFDRDDLIDADFDVVPWIKQEMNMMLEEEQARAYLFGDGRSAANEDKIDESHIIPVIKDEDLFAIKVTVTPGQDETLEHAIIDSVVLAQDDYQGSGNTVAFIEANQVSKMLIMEDKFGHRLYKSINELASAMGVSKIEKVPSGIVPNGYYGVILDLKDYNVGQKNGGAKSMFDDFDIDYNQQKYLIETRQSAALVRPYSAIVLKSA